MPAMIGFSGLRTLFRARRDETLGVIVIDASAQIVIAGGDLVVFGECCIGAAFELRAHCTPLFAPGLRIGLPPPKLLADTVDLLERDHAIGRHALQDQSYIGPKKVIAKMVDPWSA